MTILRRLGALVFAAAVCAVQPEDAVCQSSIVDTSLESRELALTRNAITIGQQLPSDRGEVGCVPNLAIAFRERRPTNGIWAAQFTVVDPGQGEWLLAVENGTGNVRWSRQLNTTGKGERLETPLIMDPSISISLRGPGAVCPRVTMDSEIKLFTRSQPRGVFDIDDRWRINQSELHAERDSQTIVRWSNAVVKLVARTADNAILPCTAFFISRHALMTAAHCVSSQSELSRGTLLFNDGTEVVGEALQLLIVQGTLDFSVIWVPDPPVTETLTLGSDSAATQDLVIWQFPIDLGRAVSVKGCKARQFDFTFVEHRCDTAVGTSGAPIQARGDGVVVALHTNGCTKVTNGTTSCKNFGERMSSILALLQTLTAAIQQEHPAKAQELIAAFAARP